jgi:hypothetical protein
MRRFFLKSGRFLVQPATQSSMAKSKKKSKGGAPAKLGAPEHFSGFKLAFLVSRAAQYQQALDAKVVAAFYNKVTLDFVAKYGQQEPFNEEFAEDPLEPDVVLEGGDGGGDDEPVLSNEEAAANAVLFTKLRTVRLSCYTYPNIC